MIRELIPMDITEVLPAFIRESKGGMPQKIAILFSRESFDKDTLDVSSLYPFARPSDCVVSFKAVPGDLLNVCKVTARMEVFFNKAATTVQKRINDIASFFNMARSQYVGINIMDFNADNVRAVLNRSDWSADSCMRKCIALESMYKVMISYYPADMVAMDLQDLDDIRRYYSRLSKATANASKTPDIDPDYFRELEDTLPFIICDESKPVNVRMTAAMLSLLMWTGNRPSELTRLTTSSSVTKKLLSGKNVDYLTFNAYKLSSGGRYESQCECFMLPGAVAAYKALIGLREMVAGHDTTDTLYILQGNLAPSEDVLRNRIEDLIVKYFPNLAESQWDEVKVRHIKGRVYSIPSMTQYRVHLCSYLYRNGISMAIIELGMSHMSSSMAAYYVRIRDRTFAKAQRRADIIIRSRINNDIGDGRREDIGEELMLGLNLSLKRLQTAVSRWKEMTEKGYEYEMDNYRRQALDIINSELEPSFFYLEGKLEKEGAESVLAKWPNLKRIVADVKTTIKDINVWRKTLTL